MGGYAWVTLATNDSYSLGALVLAHSLRKSNTAHKLAVLITPAVSQPMREQLQTVFDVVKTTDVLDSKDEAHLALMKRPELGITFTKIHCWRLTEFEKCVFLDADTLVVRNCDELFEREEFSAAPDVSWPDCFNSGVFVYKPSVETFNKLLQFAVEKGSFDGGDQGLLNQFFSDWATEDIKKHLPFVYNLTSVAAYSYIPAFKQYGSETRIVHFIGTGKPWLHQLDPATKTVTPSSGSEHLAPLLQQWWDLFCEKVHPNLSKNLENNNDGMSHPPVEACSNILVALTSDEPQPPRLIEPCLQYREKDDYRQHNLPYQPFDVRGSSGELLNVEFLLASVVHSDSLGEQQRQEGEELEEKDTKPEVQEEADGSEQAKLEIIDNKGEEKKEEQSAPRDPFDYNTFFPDEKCVNNYLEQNVLTYQPFEAPCEDPQPVNIPLPRFLTMPEDDQRQKGNIEVAEHQQAQELLPPVPQEEPIEVQRQPSPSPLMEKHELPKSKSMTFISSDVTGTVIPSPPPVRSIWKSQPNVNVDVNRKYSMPRLKPLLPRQNSRSMQSHIPRVTLYTEFLMSADYKDPVDIPKDEVGFVETELRRSKSEADLKGKFGPLPYTKSPEVEIPEPKKPPLPELDNDAYDLTRCKRQLGNKPRDNKKENITSKLITPSKDKISTLIKKRKSKELSPGDGGKEKPHKKERKEHQGHNKNENLEKILNRLWEFSKNYQHYFGVDTQSRTKERPIQSEFKNFRNFVKNKKETTQKGLLGLRDIMTKKKDGRKVRNENIRCSSDIETSKIVNGLNKAKDKNIVVTSNSEVKKQKEKNTHVEVLKTLTVSPDRCKVRNEKQSVEPIDQELITNKAGSDKPRADSLTTLENISSDQDNIKTREGEIITDKHSRNIEHDKTAVNNEVAVFTEISINQNRCKSLTDSKVQYHSIKSKKTDETIMQNEKNDGMISKMSNNGCISLPNASAESLTQTNIPEKSEKGRTTLATDITNHPQFDIFSTSTTKKPEKKIEDNLFATESQTSIPTQVEENLKLPENILGNKKDTIMATQTNGESFKTREDEKTQDLSLEKVQRNSEVKKTQCPLNFSENGRKATVNEEEKEDELRIAALVRKVQEEIGGTVQNQKPSERLRVLHKDNVQSDVRTPTLAEIEQETTPEVSIIPQGSEIFDAQKTIPQEIYSLQAANKKSTPKRMFTIGSPERSAEIQEKDSAQPNENNLSFKQTEEVPQTSKAWDNIPKPDEILCVPDFETPRSSRILVPIPQPDTDATPQAPPSSPIAIPRKARIQRKPYENGTKYRSPAGKKSIKTGDSKNCVGIAGAIAQLNLEADGKASDSEAMSAAHQEYIRRQNWESGNIDYMGRDSFENVWSKICQTLEGKDLDKATENTQSPMTISTEEKTKPEEISGVETPVLFSAKCPEFIDALPSEPVTDPVEEDEVIFSKPEIRQKCLTNIKEEEENGSALEGGNVRLSDILKPKEMMRPLTTTVGISKACAITPVESNLTTKLSEESQTDEKLQATNIITVPTPSDLDKHVNEQTKPGSEAQAPKDGIVKTQHDEHKTEVKSQTPSECTTVAIHQSISILGALSEVQTATKTTAQKIADKKLQQKPEKTPTEPIPLPAPESPTRTECKTVAIPYTPLIQALADERQPSVKEAIEPAALSSGEVPAKTSPKEEKQKKGVFSKILEMVGVAPKIEEVSKSVFYNIKEEIPKAEGSEISEPNAEVSSSKEVNKKSQSIISENEPKELDTMPDFKPDNGDENTEKRTGVRSADQTLSPETKQELDSSIPASGIPALDVKPGKGSGKKKPSSDSRKSGQAPMPKPARNASPKSSAQTTKNKSPSPITIPQMPPETALTVATPTPPPEPPKRRNSALLKVDESIPATPPVLESSKESSEPMRSEIENIIEKAKTEVENILQDRRSVEKEADESDMINTMKLIGAASQPKEEEVEELKVTSEEERQRHKAEVVSSKLSDQILKAIPPPRRKAISESKSEASGSSGAIPKTSSGEKSKHKASSIPVPPPRNKGKPSTPTPPKGKTKK